MDSFLWWTGVVFWLLIAAGLIIALVALGITRAKQAIEQAILNIEARKKP